MIHQPALDAPTGAPYDVAQVSAHQRAAPSAGLWRLLGALVLSIVLLVGLLIVTKDDTVHGATNDAASQLNDL